jgi:hypothetical protein
MGSPICDSSNMNITNITFSKIDHKLITAHLSFDSANHEHGTIRAEGVSRKQCIFNLCKEGKLPWKLFGVARALAMQHNDPRFPRVSHSREDDRLADICDDLNCSISEARHFQETGEHPANW